MKSQKAFWVMAVMLLGVGTGFAQSGSGFERLARSVPDEALLVVGSSGLAELKPILEETLIGRCIQDPNLRAFVQPLIQKMFDEASADANEIATVKTWWQRVNTIIQNPMLFTLCLRRQVHDPNEFPFYGALVLDCQGRRNAVEALINQLLDTMDAKEEFEGGTLAGIPIQQCTEEREPPIYYAWVDSKLVLAVNDSSGKVLQGLKTPGKMPSALQAVPGCGDLNSLYFDASRLPDLLKQIQALDEEITAPDWLLPLLDILGLRDIQSLVMRNGVQNKTLIMHQHLGLSGPPRGLFALLKPADQSLFAAADPCTSQAAVWHWDVKGTLDLGMKAAALVDANAPVWIDRGFLQAKENTGVAIREQLLANLAGPTALYNVPPGIYPEVFMGGGVFLVRLRDPNSFVTAMESLGSYLSKKSQGQLMVRTEDGEQGPLHIWSISALIMMQIMPTWTVVDDLWVVGSNIPLCQRAVQRLRDPELKQQSLAETATFKKATQGVPDNALYVEFNDNSAQFKQVLQVLPQFWPMIVMGAMQEGISLPPTLPKLDHLAQDLRPACSYSFLNDQGLFSCQEGPQATLYSTAGIACGMGILMPALVRTRHLAERMESGTNLSAIGKACLIYANDHDDAFPPNLAVLVAEGYLQPDQLQSSLCRSHEPGADYLYIPQQTVADDPQNVVAYENPDKNKRPDEGANVLFLDSHVEFCKAERLEELLQATTQRLGDRAPRYLKP